MNKNNQPSRKITAAEVDNCISVLEHLLKNGDQLIHLTEEQRIALMKTAGQLTRPHRAEIKQRNKSVKLEKKQRDLVNDRNARAAAAIRSARKASIFEAPNQLSLPEIKENKEKKEKKEKKPKKEKKGKKGKKKK